MTEKSELVFTTDHRKDLHQLLRRVKTQWKNICIALHYDPATVQGAQQAPTVQQLFNDLVEKITGSDKITKQMVVDALKSDPVGHGHLAGKLEQDTRISNEGVVGESVDALTILSKLLLPAAPKAKAIAIQLGIENLGLQLAAAKDPFEDFLDDLLNHRNITRTQLAGALRSPLVSQGLLAKRIEKHDFLIPSMSASTTSSTTTPPSPSGESLVTAPSSNTTIIPTTTITAPIAALSIATAVETSGGGSQALGATVSASTASLTTTPSSPSGQISVTAPSAAIPTTTTIAPIAAATVGAAADTSGGNGPGLEGMIVQQLPEAQASDPSTIESMPKQTLTLLAGPPSLDVKAEKVRLVKEAVQKILGHENVGKVSRKKNEGLFSRAHFDYNRENYNSEGEFYDRIQLVGSSTGPHTQPGVLDVTISAEIMNEVSTTISAKASAGISKGGLSISQEIATSVTNTITTKQGTSFVAKLPYTITSGSADVLPCIDLYVMKTPLRNVRVILPAESKVSYKVNPLVKPTIKVSELGEIHISGEYTWIYPRMVAIVTPIKQN